MNIKILIGDRNFVDFSNPIKMSKEQKEKFMNLLNSIFDPSIIEEEKVGKPRNWRIGDKVLYPRYWSAEEYAVLLKSNIQESINRLGRSGMAVIVQDGFWRPQYFQWCNQKGKHPFGKNMLQNIKDFMKEHESMIKKKREKRKKRRTEKKTKEKEYIQLKEEIPKLRKLSEQGILINKKDVEKKEKRLNELKDYKRREK